MPDSDKVTSVPGASGAPTDVTTEGPRTGALAGNEVSPSSDSVAREDFQKFQSKMDQKLAAMERQLQDEREAKRQLEAQMLHEKEARATTPEEKMQLMEQRHQAELEQYRVQDNLNRAKAWFKENYGIEADVFDGIAREEDLWPAALAHQKRLAEESKRSPRAERAHELKESGATAVPTGTPAGPSNPDDFSIDKLRNSGRGEDWLRKGGGARIQR